MHWILQNSVSESEQNRSAQNRAVPKLCVQDTLKDTETQYPSLLKNKHSSQTGRRDKSTQLSDHCRKRSSYFRGDVGVCNVVFISTDIKTNIKVLVTGSFPPAYCWEAAVFRGCDLTDSKEIQQQHQEPKRWQWARPVLLRNFCCWCMQSCQNPGEWHQANMITRGVSHHCPVLGNQHLPSPLTPEYTLLNLFFN